MLSAADPAVAAWEAAAELDGDPTVNELVEALPPDVSVLVAGGSEIVTRALRRRGDARVGPSGLVTADEAATRADCVPVPELTSG